MVKSIHVGFSDVRLFFFECTGLPHNIDFETGTLGDGPGTLLVRRNKWSEYHVADYFRRTS
jgi:hypothetical protein